MIYRVKSYLNKRQNMKDNFNTTAFGILSLGFLVALSFFLVNNYQTNLGKITYFFDDAYIHLAIAENFAIHGIPSSDGISPSNGSSSPLWLLMLTFLFNIFSKDQMELLPLIINTLTSIGILFYIVKTLSKLEVFTTTAGIIMAGVVAIAIIPLVPLTMVGMEHGLQTLIALAFIFHSNEYLEKRNQEKHFKVMIILGMLLPMVRYEMSLLVFIVVVYSLVKFGKMHFKKSIFLLVISATPVVLYGLYMLHMGLSFFPDSVIAKGSSGDNMLGIILDDRPSAQAKKIPIILMLVLPYIAHILIFLAMFRISRLKEVVESRGGDSDTQARSQFLKPKTMLWAIIAGTMALFQIMLSMPTPVRYDGYLMAIGSIPLLELIALIFKRKVCTSYIPGTIFLSSVFALFLISKLALGHTMMIFGVNNIHDQQRQTALFISDYAKAKKVAINDLGMVSFYTNAEIYDLEGLGTHEVALMKKNKTFSPEAIVEKISNNGTDWIIIYDEWYADGNYIPKQCSKVGETKIKMNLICGSDVVSFYYCGEDLGKAKSDFQEFGKNLGKRTQNRTTSELK